MFLTTWPKLCDSSLVDAKSMTCLATVVGCSSPSRDPIFRFRFHRPENARMHTWFPRTKLIRICDHRCCPDLKPELRSNDLHQIAKYGIPGPVSISDSYGQHQPLKRFHSQYDDRDAVTRCTSTTPIKTASRPLTVAQAI